MKLLRTQSYLWSLRLSRFLPKAAALALSGPLALMAHGFKRRERAAVCRNLARVTGLGREDPAVRRMARRLYLSFGRHCVDLLYDTRRERSGGLSAMEGLSVEPIAAALQKGKGAILLSAHVGNWEFAAMAVARQGIRVTVVANDHVHPAIQNFFVDCRRRQGVLTVSNRKSVRDCLRILKANGCVGILGDRLYGMAGHEAEFFSSRTMLPKGPVYLSLLSGAPVVLGAWIEDEPGRPPRLLLKEPVYPPETRSPQSVEAFSGRVTREIEDLIRQQPASWFCFEDIWPAAKEAGAHE